jgi:hypothetical protein
MLHALILATTLASAVPCTSAIPQCTEWIAIEGQESRLLVYRTHSLVARNDRLTRALVFVHGINRDADNHFRTALAAAVGCETRRDNLMLRTAPGLTTGRTALRIDAVTSRAYPLID